MMNKSLVRPTGRKCHLQRLDGQVLIWLRSHCPANHPARVQIKQHGQIQPATPRRDGGQVAHPDLIGGESHENLVHAVGCRWGKLLPFDHEAEPPHAASFESVQPAQLGDPVAAARDSRCQQGVPHLDGPIVPFGLPMELLNLLKHAGVGAGPRAGWAASPSVVAAPIHAQRLAQLSEPIRCLVCVDKPIPHGDSLAKYMADFFKMFRSSRSRAFSHRRRVSSSVLWARPPLPGNAASPYVSNACGHLYKWLCRSPNSQASAAAGRSNDFQSRTASRLNSVVNCCCSATRHLPGVLPSFESVHANRASPALFKLEDGLSACHWM